MPNSHFQFKEFRIEQADSGMKVTTDACLFGAWCASELSQNSKENSHLLDIGTGTGLLSLMVAQKNNHIEVNAIEINNAAYDEANSNFINSPWNDRIIIKNISLQDYQFASYDFVICNPPFFSGSQTGNDTNKNQAIHSNSLSQNDLVQNVFRLLKDDGCFYLLYPEREMNTFIDLSKSHGLYIQTRIMVRNQKDKPVFRTMASFSKVLGKETKQELIIKSFDNQYTKEFWHLLSPYYLDYNAPV